MLSYLKNILLGEVDEGNNDMPESTAGNKLHIATCALFVELANSDDEFSEEEKKLIYNLMKAEFSLSEEELNELFELAENKIKHNVSIYEYTQIINNHFSKQEKYEILKNLWKLVFIDGSLDAHEDYFIRKVSNNLNLEHRDMIAAKMEVKQEISKR